MKKQTIFRMLPLTLILLLLGSVAMAQTKEETEKFFRGEEMKAKQAQLEQQQQEMKEQQLITIQMERAYADQARESARASSSSRARSSSRAYSYSSGSSDESPYVIVSSGQGSQSQLSIRNSYKGTSDTSQGEFDVNESTTQIRCMINGKVRSGKITIKVLYPGGKVFKDLSITSSAEISFTQSLSIKEGEKKKYVGSWTYEVTADKAEGSYTLSFMTH